MGGCVGWWVGWWMGWWVGGLGCVCACVHAHLCAGLCVRVFMCVHTCACVVCSPLIHTLWNENKIWRIVACVFTVAHHWLWNNWLYEPVRTIFYQSWWKLMMIDHHTLIDHHQMAGLAPHDWCPREGIGMTSVLCLKLSSTIDLLLKIKYFGLSKQQNQPFSNNEDG